VTLSSVRADQQWSTARSKRLECAENLTWGFPSQGGKESLVHE
jgi:hypothetical protein